MRATLITLCTLLLGGLLTAWWGTLGRSLSYCGPHSGFYVIDGALDWCDLNEVTDRETGRGFKSVPVNYDMGPPQARLPLLPLAIGVACILVVVGLLPARRAESIVSRRPWLTRAWPIAAISAVALALWLVSQFRFVSLATPPVGIVLKFGDALIYWSEVSHRLDNTLGPMGFGVGRLPVRGCECCERAGYRTIGPSSFDFSLAWVWAIGMGIFMGQLWLKARATRGLTCIRCGYDLRSITSNRCPECGDSTPDHPAAQ